jgi:hypothetical protein
MRDIPGFPDYRGTDEGEIVSFKGRKPRTLKPSNDGHYFHVSLRRDGKTYCRAVHVLIALAYHGEPPEGMECRHWDGNNFNNRPENLGYATHSQNQLDQIRHGTHAEARRTHCDNGHEYTSENTRTRMKNGRPTRVCVACTRTAVRDYMRRRRSYLQPSGSGSTSSGT